MRRRLAVVVPVVGLALGGGFAIPPAHARPPTRAGIVETTAFERVPCPAGVFSPARHVRCGRIHVPENRADPGGRQITVAAAIVPARSTHPAPDPIVFVEGGPSVGAIAPFSLDFYFAGARFAFDHDVVLVDTRGTGLSRPYLGCPELDHAAVDAFYAPPTVNAQAAPILTAAVQACHDRLAARGIDLAAYTTAASAADLDDLRRALEVTRWNVLAASADGGLGLTYLRLFPAAVRSLIVDSGMSTQMQYDLDYDRGLAQELDSIFAGCAATPACATAYPGLRERFLRKVAQLNAHPVSITFPDYRPHPVTLQLDGAGLYADTLFSIFAGNRFAPSGIPFLLDTLWRQTHGELVQTYREAFGTGPTVSDHENAFAAQGKTLSYVCHDSLNFLTPADLAQAALDVPPFAPRYLDPDFDLGDGFTNVVSPAACRVWDVGRAPAVQYRPVRSSVPTLILAGEYDTGVPPYVVRQVGAELTRSYYYEFPASGHLQLASYNGDSDCARDITDQFLAAPAATPDSSCIATLPPVDFTP